MGSKKTYLLLCGCVIGLSLVGCVSTQNADGSKKIHYDSLNGEPIDSSFERKRLSVVAADVQMVEKRRETYEVFIQSPEVLEAVEHPERKTELFGGAVANIIGDSVTGTFNSDLGTNLQMGAMAFNIGASIFRSMQTRIMQRAYAPPLFNGEVIDSRDKARDFMIEQLKLSLFTFGENKQISMRCITDHCNSYAGTFELDISNLTGVPTSSPDKVYLNYFNPFLAPERVNPIRDLALGYKAEFGHVDAARGLYVAIWANVDTDAEGNALIATENFQDRFDLQGIIGGEQITESLLGQYILTGIYSNPYMLMVIDGIGTKRIFYNGQVYAYNTRLDAEEGFVVARLNLEEALLKQASQEGVTVETSETE